MKFTYNLYCKIILGLIGSLYVNPTFADGLGGLRALDELFEAFGWFLFFVYGVVTASVLTVALLKKRNTAQGYYTHIINVIIFACISIPWYLTPELSLTTVVVLLVSGLFVVVLCYHELDKAKAHWLVGGIFLVVSSILLNNPTILTLNNYILSDDLPFVSSLTFSTITDPKYANLPGNRFMKTSDGRLFYSDRWNYSPKSYHEGIRMEGSDDCRNPCFVVYGLDLNYKPLRPKAIFDFQKHDNSPEADKHRTALINIPLRDYYINRYSDKKLGVYSLVKDSEGRLLWNPASSWLWRSVCSGGVDDDLANLLLEANADSNYRPTKDELTTFYCAIKSRKFERVEQLGSRGGNPNTIFKSNIYTHRYYANALFLVLETYGDIDKKRQRLRYLISLGANINVQNPDGHTLLHAAINQNNNGVESKAELVRILVGFGARHDIRNSDGLTPIEVAIQKRNMNRKNLVEKAHMSEAFIKEWKSYVIEYQSIIDVLAKR